MNHTVENTGRLTSDYLESVIQSEQPKTGVAQRKLVTELVKEIRLSRQSEISLSYENDALHKQIAGFDYLKTEINRLKDHNACLQETIKNLHIQILGTKHRLDCFRLRT